MSPKKLPQSYIDFKNEFPEVEKAYQKLGEACHQSSRLDDKNRRLIKLALAIAAGSEGAVHSHVRQALDEGISEADIKDVAILAIPTIGFSKTMAAFSWMKDVLGSK